MNIRKRFGPVLISVAALVAAALPAMAANGTTNVSPGTTFSGTVVTFSGRTRSFTLRINGFTSDTAANRYLGKLKTDGQDGFYKAIDKQDLGYFALDGSVGHDLKYVTETRTQSGTKIIAVFDRWLKPFELRYGTRSKDYPFTYIELFLKKNGKVTGTVIGAARVRLAKEGNSALDFENFAAYPAKLTGISVSEKGEA